MNNFSHAPGGCIAVIWNKEKFQLHALSLHAQTINCEVTCTISHFKFMCSFIYGCHTVMASQGMWNSLSNFGYFFRVRGWLQGTLIASCPRMRKFLGYLQLPMNWKTSKIIVSHIPSSIWPLPNGNLLRIMLILWSSWTGSLLMSNFSFNHRASMNFSLRDIPQITLPL